MSMKTGALSADVWNVSNFKVSSYQSGLTFEALKQIVRFDDH